MKEDAQQNHRSLNQCSKFSEPDDIANIVTLDVESPGSNHASLAILKR